MSKILVVGGAGYIGSHVAKTFQKAGHQVAIFDSLVTGRRENVLPDMEFIEGDLLHPAEIDVAVKGVDAIIHMAAFKAAGESMVEIEKYATNNLVGAVNLLNSASKNQVKKIIFSSSSSVYGEAQYTPIDENHPTEPVSFYGFTKLEIEKLLRWYDMIKDIKFVALRYFNAVGYDHEGVLSGLEKDPQCLLPVVMEAIMGWREKVAIFGDDYNTPDGTCIRDYVHVDDLADAHLKAFDYLIAGHQSLSVNLGSEKGMSVKEIISKAKEISGVDFKAEMAPRRPGDPAVVLADARLAKNILNWEAKYSDVETVIKTTLNAYYKNR